jgi:hypothetical protein
MPAKLERGLMFALRYVLPAVTILGGLIVMAFGTEIDLEGGAGIVSAGLAIYGMNWLYRASIDGDKVREQEAAARAHFSAHGHWPDEAPPRAESAPEAEGDGSNTAMPGPKPHSGQVAQRPMRPHTSSGSRRRTRG